MRKFGPPFYKQELPDSCLPTCLRMLLAERGQFLTEARIRKLCGYRPLYGALSTDVVTAAQALGFIDTEETQSLRLADLRDEIRAGTYPIVGVSLRLLNGMAGEHAQVVVEVTSTLVRVHDPLLGRKPLTHATFEAAWEDAGFMTILVK